MKEISLETDMDKIKKNLKKKKKRKSKTRVVRKHSLKYDNIHNANYSDDDDEFTDLQNADIDIESAIDDYYSDNVYQDFKIDNRYDIESTHNAVDYNHNITLKKQVYNNLIKYTELDFSPDKRRRIPSPGDLNAYYTMLINELDEYKYSHTEIFTTLSEFFTDNIWNVYKKLDKKYKAIIIKELQNKYNIKELDEINFL